jgi:hypothetical protein
MYNTYCGFPTCDPLTNAQKNCLALSRKKVLDRDSSVCIATRYGLGGPGI